MNIINNVRSPAALLLLLFAVVLCVCVFGSVGFNLENRNPIIKRHDSGTYFGYSVAQHKVLDKSNDPKNNWLLVGAPLGHNLQPGTNRSGALYKCPITYYTDDCVQVATDGRRMEGGQYLSEDDDELHPPRSDEIKEDQWMGVTVRSQGPAGMVMVCAHRYVTIKNKQNRYGQGLCYILTNELEYENAYEPCKGRPTQREHQDYGFCQTGTSGALLADGNAIFGAPGPYTWRGTLFVQTVDGDFLSRDKTVYMGPVSDASEPVDKYSYLGMSVTAGNFLGKETLFAAGAPRSNDTGQVIIFSKRTSNSLMDVVMKLDGEQFASSFGYEMAAADINGDGKSDLFVGAPFYFSRNEGGAVYVYTDLSCKYHCKPALKLTGPVESRYGFAISGLGDINKDHYDDVAIGAPYQDNGAVYIYLGSKQGLLKEPSQILLPLDSPITTLGYSLSGGLDMDENGYPDLLVGAYDSDAVLVYRGRVIMDISTEITGPGLKNIDPSRQKCVVDPSSNATCFTFRACCTLKVPNSKVLNAKQSLLYSIVAESFTAERRQPRVYFKPDKKGNKTHKIGRAFTLEPRKLTYCHDETVYLKEGNIDILTPIKFRLNYTLGNDSPMSIMLNKQKSEKIFMATFQKDCGDDDICQSNLVLNARIHLPASDDAENEYIWTLGANQELEVEMNVTNHGDPAYETHLYVEHHPSLSYIAIGAKTDHIICNYRNDTWVACNLGNPFKKDRPANFYLRFEPKNLGRAEKKLDFHIFVNSTSKEQSTRTSQYVIAHVVRHAEVSLTRGATSYIFYGGAVKGESAMKYLDDVGSRVGHTYYVQNSGPGKIEYLEVHIEWPFQVANNKPLGKWLLYLEDRPIIEGGEYCQMPEGAVNPLELGIRPGTQDVALDNDPTYPPNAPYNMSTRTRRDTEMVIRSETFIDNDGHKRKIINMNCQNGTAKCVRFHCVVKNLESSGTATIKIKSRLWNSTLVQDYPRIDWVRIVSTARIVIPTDFALDKNDPSNDVAIIETLAYPDLKDQQEAEPAPLWIIIVAVVAGLLLLILLTLGLWKLGFFKRQRYDPTLSGNLEKHPREDDPFLNS